MEKHKLPFAEELIKHCNNGGMSYEEVELSVKDLLNLKNKPDAVLITSDRSSTSCLTILHRLDLSIPDDLAIAGFTNSNTAELFNPPLTTIRQPAFKIGQLATEKLISIIESKYPVTEFTTQLLDTEFSIRSSSVPNKKLFLPAIF